MRKSQIAKPRFIPLKKNIPQGLQRIVARMPFNPLCEIAKASLSDSMKYHCCNKCIVCAAVVELVERTAFMEYEGDYVKALVEG